MDGRRTIAPAHATFAALGDFEQLQMGHARPDDVLQEDIALEPDFGDLVELAESRRGEAVTLDGVDCERSRSRREVAAQGQQANDDAAPDQALASRRLL